MVPKGITPSPIGWALAVLLSLGGLGLFFKPPIVRTIAVAISILVAASGVLAWLGHPEASLPASPVMTMIVGLYLAFRVFMAQVYAKQAEAPSVNDEDTANDG